MQRHVALAAHLSPRRLSVVVEETAVVDSSVAYLSAVFINQLILSLFLALDAAGWWFASLTLASGPPSSLGCDGDRRLHVGVDVAVIGERPRRAEGELESLVLGEIARGTENPSRITGHRMWSIRGIQPLHLRSHFDRERCRLEGVLPILLDDLHFGHLWS